MNGSRATATLSQTMSSTTTTTMRVPLFNSTMPPEKYWFIPGSTPTFANKTAPTLPQPPPSNGTGYNYLEDGETETGLNELQTLFLACFATLLPLVVILIMAFTIRILWRRYKRRRECPDYDGVIHRESNSEQTDRPLHAHLLNGDKLGETHLNADDICDGAINNGIKGNRHSTTNDIQEDSRETTMKYSPSARDGVFVVEVQQGVRRSPTSAAESCLNDQRALIHNPPERYSDDEALQEGDEKYYPETTSRTNTPELPRCKTGLSQSDESLTCPSYTYGTQHGYDEGHYGYPVYNGYVNDEPLQRLEDRNKPKITSAVYKSMDDGSRGSIDLLVDGPLLSDLGRRDDYDDIQEEQIRLGNSTGKSKIKR